MAETIEVTVTKTWVKVSDGDCTLQSVNPSNEYEVSASATTPTVKGLSLKLNEPVNIAYKTAVWCRLKLSSIPSKADAKIIVIK